MGGGDTSRNKMLTDSTKSPQKALNECTVKPLLNKSESFDKKCATEMNYCIEMLP
jgi:hypothetical protein